MRKVAHCWPLVLDACSSFLAGSSPLFRGCQQGSRSCEQLQRQSSANVRLSRAQRGASPTPALQFPLPLRKGMFFPFFNHLAAATTHPLTPGSNLTSSGNIPNSGAYPLSPPQHSLYSSCVPISQIRLSTIHLLACFIQTCELLQSRKHVLFICCFQV